MTSLGDVYLDVHANTKALPGEVRRAGKQMGKEGEVAGKKYSQGFGKGVNKNRSSFVSILRHLSGVERGIDRTFGRSGKSRILNFFNAIGRGALKLAVLPFKLIGAFAKFGKAAVGAVGSLIEAFKYATAAGLSFAAAIGEVGKSAISVAGAAMTNILLNANPAGLITMAGAFIFLAAAAAPLAFALVGVAGALTALTSSVAFALGAGLAVLAGLFVPAAAGVAVLIAGFVGLDKAAKKALKQSIKPMTKELKGLGKVAAEGLFKNAEAQAKRFAPVIHSLRPLVRGVANDIRRLGGDFIQAAKGPGFKTWLADVKKFIVGTKQADGAITLMGRSAGNALGGLGGIFRAMIPTMQTFLKWIDKNMRIFNKWANDAGGQSAIAGFFTRASTAAKSLWGLLKSIGGLLKHVFTVGVSPGNTIIDTMTRNIRQFTDYLRANPDALANFFAKGIQMAKVLGSALVFVSKVLGFLAMAAYPFFKLLGGAAIILGHMTGSSGLRKIGQDLLDAGDSAKTMAAEIQAATQGLNNLGGTEVKLKYQSWKQGAKTIKDSGRTIAQVMQDVGKSTESKFVYKTWAQGAAAIKKTGRTVAQAMQDVGQGPAGKGGGKQPTIKIPWSLGKFTGPNIAKAALAPLRMLGGGGGKGGGGGVKVPWSLAPKPSGGMPTLFGGGKGTAAKVTVPWKWGKAPRLPSLFGGKGAAAKTVVPWKWGKAPKLPSLFGGKGSAPKATVPWKWGKAPKFPKITGGDIKIKISGAGAFDKAKAKAKQLTAALKATDRIDPNIKIKDNAGKAKSNINSVRSALSRLNGKTSHVYIITHKKTKGGYLGGPAMSALSFARGGKLPGTSPSDPTVDNLSGFAGSRRSPIMLRSGEFIMNEPATKMFQPLLEAMNKAGNKKIGLAEGGMALPGSNASGSSAPIAASPVGPTEAQMRRQAELNAKALLGGTFKVQKDGNLKLLSLGG